MTNDQNKIALACRLRRSTTRGRVPFKQMQCRWLYGSVVRVRKTTSCGYNGQCLDKLCPGGDRPIAKSRTFEMPREGRSSMLVSASRQRMRHHQVHVVRQRYVFELVAWEQGPKQLW
jgi:hypothetical protein